MIHGVFTKGPAVALFVLSLLLLGWSGYYAAQQLLPGWQGEREGASADGVVSSGIQPAAVQYDTTRIIDAHLFGRAEKPAVNKTEPAPETRLQISLLGLISSADKEMVRAIIRVQGSNIKTYGIGQTIEGTDATLDTVQNDRVLLRRGDALETLPLKRTSLGDVAGAIERAAPAYERVNETSPLNDPSGGERLDQSAIEQMTLPF